MAGGALCSHPGLLDVWSFVGFVAATLQGNLEEHSLMAENILVRRKVPSSIPGKMVSGSRAGKGECQGPSWAGGAVVWLTIRQFHMYSYEVVLPILLHSSAHPHLSSVLHSTHFTTAAAPAPKLKITLLLQLESMMTSSLDFHICMPRPALFPSSFPQTLPHRKCPPHLFHKIKFSHILLTQEDIQVLPRCKQDQKLMLLSKTDKDQTLAQDGTLLHLIPIHASLMQEYIFTMEIGFHFH